MSNQYIPKEKLTAYERWEVAAFDEAQHLAKALRQAEVASVPVPATDAAEPTPSPPPAPEPAPALNEEELSDLRQQAFDEGRAAGFEAGLDEGYKEGLANGEAAAKTEAEHIAQLAKSFTLSLETSESALADAILQLSLDLAAQVLCTSLQVKPELLIPVVREAMTALASPHGHPNLLLHPDDAAVVRQHMGEQLTHTGWRIIEDTQISRGGCRIENGGAEIDATLPTRWRRVIETLSLKSDWLPR